MILTIKSKQLAIFGKTLDEIRQKLITLNSVRNQYGWFGRDGVFNSLFGSNKPQIIPEANLTKVLSFA